MRPTCQATGERSCTAPDVTGPVRNATRPRCTWIHRCVQSKSNPQKIWKYPFSGVFPFCCILLLWQGRSALTSLDAKVHTSTAKTASSYPSAKSKTLPAPSGSWSTGPTEKAPPRFVGEPTGRTAGASGTYESTSPKTQTGFAPILNIEPLATGPQKRSSPAKLTFGNPLPPGIPQV